MNNKALSAKKSELCELYTKAISDFKEWFESQRKILEEKNKRDSESENSQESE